MTASPSATSGSAPPSDALRRINLSNLRKLQKWTVSRRALRKLAEIGRTSGEDALPTKCLVGTFHKVGTVLLSSVLSDFADAGGFAVWDARYAEPAEGWMICRHSHSEFGAVGLSPADHPTVIILRDPRDVVVSAMKYHKKSVEPWLHEPNPEFDGRTYQEQINALADDRARMIFEFSNSAGRVVRRMMTAKTAPEHANTLFVKLEDLMADKTLAPFDRIFRHMGVSPAWLPVALKAAYDRSLFNPSARFAKGHVTSGRTEIWRETYDEELRAAFEEAFPGAVEALGYSW